MNKEDVVQALMNAACNCITDSELRDHFEQIIFGNHFDHPKVKLPREVGEELEYYQDEDIDLLDYLHDVIYSKELRATRVWMLGDREHRIGILADAYRYGWEAEPEERFYVKTPESWKAASGDLNWLYKPSYGGVSRCNHIGGSDEQFTRAELKKYHLDSKIFTLVPVGVEHG